MATFYTTSVDAVGGRNGTIKSEDGLLEVQLAVPKEMGGKGGATNPEQLFAGGYAACFGNAILHVARTQKYALKDDDVEVKGTVSIGTREAGGFGLTVALDIILANTSQEEAETLVAEADKTCPYSNAVRGNVDVSITVNTK